MPELPPTAVAKSLISTFPLELLKLIACTLPTALDITNFSAVSRSFHAAVYSDQFVFRGLFHALYEPPHPSVRRGYSYSTAVKSRHLLLHRSSYAPDVASTKEEGEPLIYLNSSTDEDIIFSMLLDARPRRSVPRSPATSRNLEHLTRIRPRLRDTSPNNLELLSAPFNIHRLPPRSAELTLLLLPHLPPVSPMPHSNAALKTIMQGTFEEQIGVAARIAQGFKTHLLEGFLFWQRNFLRSWEMPGFWNIEGMAAGAMGNRWLGGYAYRDGFHVDLSESTLSEFTLSSTSSSTFTGEGRDFAPFQFSDGHVVRDDRGWGQVRCRKEYIHLSGAPDPVWEYAGVMTPGGNIIAGMWWNEATQELGRFGVFLWWNIPEESEGLGRGDLGIRSGVE